MREWLRAGVILTALLGYTFSVLGFVGGCYLGLWMADNWTSNAAKILFGAFMSGITGMAGYVGGFLWYFLLANWEVKMAQEDEDEYYFDND